MQIISSLIQYLSNVLEQERPQWLLWMPVAIGSGIAVYFALDKEPALIILAGLFVLLIVLTGWFRHNSNLFVLLMALTLINLGMLAACWRTHYLATPMLNKPLPTQYLEGTIDKIEHMPNYQRLTLTRLVLAARHLSIAPHTARISFRGQMLGGSNLQPGMRVQLKAALMPPTEAVAPQAYDFRRRSYFEGIGAVGFAVQQPELISTPQPSIFLDRVPHYR
jgi:competence protein ComEC